MAKALKVVEDQAVTAPVPEKMAIRSVVERIATDPNISIERVEQAFAFWQKVEADEARKASAADFVAAQAEMEPVAKDAPNSQTKSKYATYDALDRVLRPIYTKYGFAISFDTEPSPAENHVRIVCYLMHRSGHERTYSVDMPCDGKGAKGGDVMTKTHAMGSAITYGRRYLLASAFNIATTDRDDDGNAASGGAADGPISEAQLRELIKIADEVGADKARFCKFYNIASFADIQASQFEKAKEALWKKARHAAAK